MELKNTDLINKEEFTRIANLFKGENEDVFPPELLEQAWKDFSEKPPMNIIFTHETKKPG